MKLKSINKILNSISDIEDKKTITLFKLCPLIRKQGYLTKNQAIKILKWKSHRPLRFYNQNKNFESVTKLALRQTDEKLKIHILTSFKGINYPCASAILMFYDRTMYPVLDIRVWKKLYECGLLKENPHGRNFKLDQWEKYLKIIRNLARKNNLTARQVEKRIFEFSKITQKGTLYKT